jgi:hypothetical protein
MSPLSVTNVVNSLLTRALKRYSGWWSRWPGALSPRRLRPVLWQDYVLVPVGAVVVIRASAAVLARS